MKLPERRSLRLRLAVPAFLTLMVIVFGVLGSFLTHEEVIVVETSGTFFSTSDTNEELIVSPWLLPLLAISAVAVARLTWWWAGRLVRPIEQIAAMTDEIQTGSLDRRLDIVDAPDEIVRLAGSFDRMLERLSVEAGIQRQLLENTSHEMRTPLAILATNTDVMLADPEPTLESYRSGTELTARTVHRLRLTIEELLTAARFDGYAVAQVGNDLSAIMRDELDRHADAARLARTPLIANGPDRLLCDIDGKGVGRALSCLIDNAIRYSAPGRPIRVTTGMHGEQAFVSVEDEGPAITEDERELVFQRYWRGDSTGRDGHGIGLSIVKQVADAHEGVSIETPSGGRPGKRFVMRFRVSGREIFERDRRAERLDSDIES